MKKILKTQKGSPITRSKYGVGKLIGGALYFHADYVNDVPFDFSDYIEALYQFDEHFDYNVIKWNKKTGNVTFFRSREFDAVHEPSAGHYVTIKKNFTAKKGHTFQVWHHKWLWVKDDYKGFDVVASFKRSQQWLQLPDIEFSKIGNKQYWETHYVPRIKGFTYHALKA
ncbi:MAG: hypothetical protein ACPGWR_27125 [Ardenticatenaceae bacterium]